ncbi:MAG TPA: hypothetical protein PLE12_09690, partial [Propionicimonas sp.]|nr:hypothetical protein [Propionicimonas sp.]
ATAVIADVLAQATVELAGGAVMSGSTLRERIEAAAARAAERLYPEFGTADDPRWPAAVKSLAEGNAQPLERLGWTQSTETHPAVKKVYEQIGAGWVTGKHLADTFAGRPYGWPADALRGSIGALVAAGLVTAQVNGAPSDAKAVMALGVRLGPLQLRRESAVVSTSQELRARSLLLTLGAAATADPLPAQITRALDAAAHRAVAVSGAPPLPQVAVPASMAAIAGHSGNEQVLALVAAGDELTAWVDRLVALEARRPARTPALDMARRLAAAAVDIESAAEVRDRLVAFEATRGLLDETDGITPILQDLAAAVRAAVTAAEERYETARALAVRDVETDPAVLALGDGRRREILEQASLLPRPIPALGDPAAVLAAASAHPPSGWTDAVDAIGVRAARARAEAAREAQPEATVVGLPGATLASASELEVFVEDLRARLTASLAEHGTIVVRPS